MTPLLPLLAELTAQLRTARGKRYYKILKLILADIGPQIVADAQKIAIDTGKLTARNVGELAVKYDLNYKATCEWLEESQILPTGTYQRLIDSGIRPRDVLAGVSGENVRSTRCTGR